MSISGGIQKFHPRRPEVETRLDSRQRGGGVFDVCSNCESIRSMDSHGFHGCPWMSIVFRLLFVGDSEGIGPRENLKRPLIFP